VSAKIWWVWLGLWTLAAAGSSADALSPGRVLFSDALNGSAAAKWRRPPTTFVDAPGGGRALRHERGTTWDGATQPWIGDDAWESYRVEVEVLPEKMWARVDFHVQESGREACSVTLFHTPEGRLNFEMVSIWGLAGAWKLWPVGQREAPHENGAWARVRLDVGDDVANLYIDDDPQPLATWYDLPFRRGGVRLATYAGSALFRNLRITELPPGSVRPILDDPWASARKGRLLRDWYVTHHQPKGYGEAGIPREVADGSTPWRPAPADARGVVNLTAIFGDDNTEGVAFARTTLMSAATASRRLWVTYTDLFELWCNGTRVFQGPPRYWSHPDRKKYGNSRLIPDQFEIVVPLKKGKNEILVRSEITEPHGWGFWIREEEP
jgi:hypothetical protein